MAKYLVAYTETYVVEADDSREAEAVADELSYFYRNDFPVAEFRGADVTVKELASDVR